MTWRKSPLRSSVRPGSTLRLLIWATLAALAFGLLGLGEVAEDALRVGRNSLHQHRASGDIVLVDIDEESLQEVGSWPWPRRRHARMVDELSRLGARRIFFDVAFSHRSNPDEDRIF